jgi:hypothetical protein
MFNAQPLEARLANAQRAGRLPKRIPFAELIELAFAESVINQQEVDQLREAERMRYKAIQVDSFGSEKNVSDETNELCEESAA